MSRWDEKKRLLEAALFAASRPLSTDDLSKFLGLSEISIEKMVEEINEELVNHPFHVVRRDEGWEMRLKDDYIEVALKFAPAPELSRSELRTLAVIALKKKISATELYTVRGNVRDQVKKLIRMGLVKEERKGRRIYFTVTGKFSRYFDLVLEDGEGGP